MLLRLSLCCVKFHFTNIIYILFSKYFYNMKKTEVPIVKPAKMKEYEFKQSKYDVAPRIPFSQIIVAPSGSGKTILLQSMILDIYRGCFERIYIWSSSIHVDSVWLPVKEYIEKEMKVNAEKERIYHDDFNQQDMEDVIELQHKISKYQKDHDFKKLFSTLIILDDFIDDARFSKHNSMLNTLFIKARHVGLNVIASSQKFNAISTVARTNVRQLYFFRLRNYKEIQSMVEELSAILLKRNLLSNEKNLTDAKNTLLEIYNVATQDKYSFLFIDLMKQNINDIFHIRFDKKILVDDGDGI